ncbi:MAG: TIGR00282 family metallophosphoesterase [Candidatus Riflebacteria bacterium]|nr:TIGR00282 family metallophosphoesterase [Candidatus Riflebacteria bacterium]
MNILCIGDIYGKTGRDAIEKHLPILKEKYKPDWIIANGENLTAGNGLSQKHLNFLKKCGVDIVTTGNHILARPDWVEVVRDKDVLRPNNLVAETAPGKGIAIFSKNDAENIAVMNLTGRIFMEPCRCPFAEFDKLYAEIPEKTPIIVDFHAEATSEKLAFFWYVNNRATLAYGTHTHVQTSDDLIMPEGNTACITDIGMTGAIEGIIGVDKSTVISRFRTGFSEKFVCAKGPTKTEGIFVKLNNLNKPEVIEKFRILS